MTSSMPEPTTMVDQALAAIAGSLARFSKEFGAEIPADIQFDAPRRREFGDFATNVAFGLAKAARTAPLKIAEQMAAHIQAQPALQAYVASCEAVAGFINLRLTDRVWQDMLAQMLREGKAFGCGRLTATPPASLEFGSANPTGPLVVVQGRTLSIGDTLARAMRFCGMPVTTEWLINDAGNQLETFALSIYTRYLQITRPDMPFPEQGYPGDYVLPIAEAIREADGAKWEDVAEEIWLPYFARFGRDAMVANHQRICAQFGVTFDLWQSERALHDAGAVERGVAALTAAGFTYEAEGALWFRATNFGDDKDRVLWRSDGRPTYYAGDVAYHYDKFARGAEQIIDILGPDHHGYIGRLKALVSAFGKSPDRLEVLIAQQMTLLRDNEPVKMSKRAGHILTLEDVLDEVGVDAARFFFILSSTDSPLTFDLELAKKNSDENPVHYVQYAHARIHAILRKAEPALVDQAQQSPRLELLGAPAERLLIARLAELPSIVGSVALTRSPHRLAKYARDVAADFHQFYAEQRIITDDQAQSAARLALALATQTTLRTILELCGVSAPESM